MFNLTENQKDWLKMVGVGLVVLGNLFLTWLGFSVPSKKTDILSPECETWLVSHDEYTAPPVNCSQQVKYLKRRIDKEVKEHGF